MIKMLSTIIVILLIAVMTQLYLNSKVNDELNQANFQIDTLEYRVDSIKSEIFVLETQLNRYQIALEMLEDENHQAASEFNKRLSLTE
jgi:hypothetical protein